MIDVQDIDGVVQLTFEHGKVNALDVEFLKALEERFRELQTSRPKAVILTGAGPAFSAGVDLQRLLDEESDYASQLLQALDGALLAIFTAPFPVVAAINGHAIAGGFVIACACDHRIMSKGKARVGVPELLVGVPWPTLALEVVRQAFAPNRSHELLLFGETHTATDAYERELVDRLEEPDRLIEVALKLATKLGSIDSAAFQSAKALLRQPTLDRLARIGPERAAEVERSWRSPETKQLIQTYFEKAVGRSS
ncbi:MAG: enoyl-CoA hydratase [Planctomycetota bacterium]|jgi:enoyl-CoA hydratase